MRVCRSWVVLFVAIVTCASSPWPAAGALSDDPARQDLPRRARRRDAASYRDGEVLVRFKSGTAGGRRAAAHTAVSGDVVKLFSSVPDLALVRLPAATSVDAALASYAADPSVLYAEPNYRVSADALPDDASFGEQWGLLNVGQSGGTPGADIDAGPAWDLGTGDADVVVGIIDSGLSLLHPDIAGNLFHNVADCDIDGTDDDMNGVIDDCTGFDAVQGRGLIGVADGNGHGTHVAGIIGAHGNNGEGITGVNWHVSLLPCRFLGNDGSGSVANAIECLDYLAAMKDRGVNLVATNNSWGSLDYSDALLDAIKGHLQRGILFVAAAGNLGVDFQHYPASYYLPNIIAVAATTRTDELASFSNYGSHTVHLGAPGRAILSTYAPGGYELLSGTSMAAPYVTGVAALLKAQDPGLDWLAIKHRILAGGDVTGLPTISRRRLNAYGALTCSGAVIQQRLRPATDAPIASVGVPVNLSVQHTNCSGPNGPVTVNVQPGGGSIELTDDAIGFDQVAGDGIYSGRWTPPAAGTFTLAFPGGDVVTVSVDVNTIVRPNAQPGDQFGSALAIDGSTLLVGAVVANGPLLNTGAAYAFDVASHGLLHTLVSPDPQINDAFGSAVALDEQFYVVGALGSDTAAPEGGAVYVYDRATGAYLRTLLSPSPRADARFGGSVALVGGNVLVGAAFDGAGSYPGGAAYLFDGFTGALLHTFPGPDQDGSGAYGYTVAAIGTDALISAPQDGSWGGVVYRYDANPSSLGFGSLIHSWEMDLFVADFIPVVFGWSMSGVGDRIAIGDPLSSGRDRDGHRMETGVAYLFDALSGALVRALKPPIPFWFGRFGDAIAVGEDWIAVSAPQDTTTAAGTAGSVYLFDARSGDPLRLLNAPAPRPLAYFGDALVTAQGSVFAGAPLDDSAADDAGAVFRVPVPQLQDHQLCYPAGSAAGEPRFTKLERTLADELDTRDVRVLSPSATCNPVSKDGSLRRSPNARLSCYRIADVPGQAPFGEREIAILNPFGFQAVRLKKAKTLCVPAAAAADPLPSDLDAYRCYKATRAKSTPRLDKRETALTDDLASMAMTAISLQSVCVPTAVNGSDLARRDNYLACYKVAPTAGAADFTAPALARHDIFGSRTLALKRAKTMCVVSQRVAALEAP